MLIRRCLERFREPKLVGAVVLLAAFVPIARFVPHPDTEQIRDWVRAAGPWFPLMFFVAHALATVALPGLPFKLDIGFFRGRVLGSISLVDQAASAGGGRSAMRGQRLL
jgi:uncharacterized membrane protein YdjX (TVP38/TMEM64 family)